MAFGDNPLSNSEKAASMADFGILDRRAFAPSPLNRVGLAISRDASIGKDTTAMRSVVVVLAPAHDPPVDESDRQGLPIHRIWRIKPEFHSAVLNGARRPQ